MKERPQLGLVCLTTSDAVRYRTMTRKRLLQLAEVAQSGQAHGFPATASDTPLSLTG